MRICLRRESIRLHAFTSTVGLADILPPIRLGESLPRWWKSLTPYSTADGSLTKQLGLSKIETARHCYGMRELFNRGVGIPLWADTHVVMNADGAIDTYSSNRELKPAGGSHPAQQFQGLLSSGAQQFKFVSPWSFVCEKPMQFIWIHPFYHQPNANRFHTMPGVVEYRNQHATNVNVVLQRPEGERSELAFSAGEMLAYLFPMFESRLELSVEEISERDIKRINMASSVTFKPLFFNRAHGIAPWMPKTSSFDRALRKFRH